ncbi:unnamed protein product [Nippostrongylus brasiliensis]|uniref:Annexin n=1 Tax=Nippostrongylus brasiliensis TaxID=27835 RepID=A0A0N4Y008_NIPBR|nr:unnamed protein product [Nippostrongylus brasiliensis]
MLAKLLNDGMSPDQVSSLLKRALEKELRALVGAKNDCLSKLRDPRCTIVYSDITYTVTQLILAIMEAQTDHEKKNKIEDLVNRLPGPVQPGASTSQRDIDDAANVKSVVRRDCESKYSDSNLCAYLQLGQEAFDRALNFTRHLIQEFPEEDRNDVEEMLTVVREHLEIILEGSTTNLTSDLIDALDLGLAASELVHNLCKDGTKCDIILIQIGKSMESLISAMEEAQPEKADEIHRIYGRFFGKKGSRTDKYDEDIYKVVSEVLNLFEPDQAI